MIRRLAVVAAIGVCASSGLSAQQQSRAELLRSATSAYDDFAPDRALDFLRVAVNPALGPTDSAWTRGVHLLTQILVEGNKPDLARTWARWAMRTAPAMQIDTVNFLAGVVAAMREARSFTSALTPGDALTQTTWRWAARGSTETNGRVLINQGTMTATVNARVVGGGLITAGTGLSIAPGTYEIEAAAVGFLPARVTREVLPGVTTVLTLTLTSATVATEDITDNARQRTFANVVPLTVRRFGVTAPACAAGAFVGRDGLLVTSYQAIRGAESVEAAGTPRLGVAAYDVASDVAILRIPGARADSIPIATAIADGQSLWAVRLGECRTPSDTRVRVARWTDRPTGALQLGDALTDAPTGTAIVDREGRLAAVWTGGASALPAPRLTPLLDEARRNAAQSTPVVDISRRENHQYGSMAIAANATGATISVTPLETWQWTGLAASGPSPLTFVGPMGRYRLQVTAPGAAAHEQEITIRPGAQQRLVVAARAVATGPETAAPVVGKRRSKLPWILGGAGGVALIGALAMGGGGGGGGGGPATTGSISVQVPVNP